MLSKEQVAEKFGFTGLTISEGVWFAEYPNGGFKCAIPDFPNDMNACNKWIVPVLREKYGTQVISFTYYREYIECMIGLPHSDSKFGKGATESKAFYSAVSKMLEGE